MPNRRIPVILALFVVLVTTHGKASWFFTFETDARYEQKTNEGTANIHAMSFSTRKIISDRRGDRLLLFILAETMHGFSKTMIDQGYAQYKGPLGAWNLLLGRYRLPFGLLENYSSERLLIETNEFDILGRSTSDGFKIFGAIKGFEYAVSFGDVQDKTVRGAFRAGYSGVDFEQIRFGISGFSWPAPGSDKRLLSADFTKYTGLIVARGELCFGLENDAEVIGLFLGFDCGISSGLDLNLGFASKTMSGIHEKEQIQAGITYNPAVGLSIRVSKNIPLVSGGSNAESRFQIYYIFSRGI